jgi:signal transduction histidine kinase
VIAEMLPNLHLHTLVHSGLEQPLILDGDEARLEQVFQNLLQNAVKYSPDGGLIKVQVECRDGYTYISVSDEGIGIPEAARDRLFQRFYRASNVDAVNIGGMGIGLYVVKEILSHHGGTVSVQSIEGQGSTFVIRLPLAATTAPIEPFM